MTVPETPVAAYLNEALDIKVNLFPEVTFNLAFPVNNLPEAVNFFLGKVIHFCIRCDSSLRQDFLA